jgi:O-antigen/teichoic acid export membrane protein
MKAILFSAAAGWLSRALAIVLNLVGIPLALAKLGPSRFSLLLVVLSIGSWIGFANIGMGRVIANTVARSRKSASRFKTETVSLALVLTAYLNLLLFAVATVLFLLAVSFIQLNEIIAANYREFVVSVVVIFFCMSLWFFLSIFEGIDAGNHQLYRLYLFHLGSYAVSLIFLVFIFPVYPSIILAAVLLNAGFLFGSTVHALDVVRRNRELFSRRWKWSSRIVRRLLLSSLDFTIIGLGIGVQYQLATGLFGFISGPQAVLELGIFIRLMQSYGALLIAFTYPVSNIVAAKLKMRENFAATRIVRLSGVIVLAGACLGGVGFWLFGNFALSLWLRTAVELDRLFVLSASLLIVLSAAQFFLSALLIGTSNVREAAMLQMWQAVAYLPLGYGFFGLWGQDGVLLAMDVVMGAGAIVMVRAIRRHPVLHAAFL